MPFQIADNGRFLGWVAMHLVRWFRPGKGQAGNTAWPVQHFKRVQGGPQHSKLALPVARLAKGTHQRVFNRCDTRHTHRTGEVRDGGQGDRAEAGGFNRALCQSNGPAADLSDGYQQDDIDLILAQIFDHGRDAFPQHLLGVQQVSHDRVMPWGGVADLSHAFQFL